MTLKEKFKKATSQWFDTTECEGISDKHAIDFYAWMQDNYYQVSDGFVKDRNIDESKRIIITIEQAIKLYKEVSTTSS